MADPGTFYCAYTDVQQLLSNDNIGIAGSKLYDEESLLAACTVSQAKIHLKLGIRTLTKLTDAIYKEVLKGIQIDLIMMRILQARQMNMNNISSASEITGFWQLMPGLTYEHQRTLAEILEERDGVAWNFDTRDGNEVTS